MDEKRQFRKKLLKLFGLVMPSYRDKAYFNTLIRELQQEDKFPDNIISALEAYLEK